MMKVYNNLEQGTQNWLDARCGLLTASVVRQVITPSKMTLAKNDKARAVAYELAAQRVTKFVEPAPTTFAMERGHVDEVYARELYSEHTGNDVEEVGFFTERFEAATLGYSPDGVINLGNNELGLIEIKSRAQKHQMKTIAVGEVPQEYMLQIQTGLLVTQAAWLDFVSYCEGMPLFIKRVLPCFEMQQSIIDATIAFDDQIEYIANLYNNNAAGFPVAPRHEQAEIML
jgi:predicted phage-related endonuclease